MLLVLACASPEPEIPDGESDLSDPVDEPVEAVGDAGTRPDPDDPSFLFADTGLVVLELELDEGALAALAVDPLSYVPGALAHRARSGVVERYGPIGVRLKGNSTYQWIDGKPALKLKFDEYTPGERFHGLERLTLDSNYWDGAQMAETLAYRMWRASDSPAARTGYATVSLNGEPLGLYTIVEAMDDGLMDQWWPGSNGGLYEMGRSCDFTLDCSCFELQDTGENFDASGLGRACAAAASGDEVEIRATWDWDRLVRYQALELGLNHPDSYTFNRNNYYVHHDPPTDRVALLPWGADSTFSYAYPPDEDRPCQPGHFDAFVMSRAGGVSAWCAASPTCWADVKVELLALADRIEAEDLAGFAAATAERIDAAVLAEPRWPWGYDTFVERSTCFQEWIAARPEQIRAYVETH